MRALLRAERGDVHARAPNAVPRENECALCCASLAATAPTTRGVFVVFSTRGPRTAEDAVEVLQRRKAHFESWRTSHVLLFFGEAARRTTGRTVAKFGGKNRVEPPLARRHRGEGSVRRYRTPERAKPGKAPGRRTRGDADWTFFFFSRSRAKEMKCVAFQSSLLASLATAEVARMPTTPRRGTAVANTYESPAVRCVAPLPPGRPRRAFLANSFLFCVF